MSDSRGQSTLAKRTYLGFIWQSLGLSLNTILSLTFLVVMARLLTPEVFGQFAIASILIAMMTITTELGLGSALIQKAVLSESDRRFVLLVNVTIALGIFLLLYMAAEALSSYLEFAISPFLIKILGVNILVVSLGMASKATLQREMRFKKIVFATSISYFVGTLLVGIVIARLGYGVWALVIGLLINNAILTLYFWVQAPISLAPVTIGVDALKMVRYGSGLCVVQGINQFSRMSDKLILASLSTLGFVGLYERSQQIQQMPGVFLGGVFDNVLFPALSRLSRDRKELGIHFFQFCTPAMMVSAYISVFIVTFSSDLVVVLLGDQWLESIPILRILAVLTFFQLLGRLSDTYVRATGIFARSVKVKVVFLVLIFVIGNVGFYLNGGIGAIAGIVVASMMHATMMVLVCVNHASYPMREFLSRAQPAVVLAIALLAKNIALAEFVGGYRLGYFLLVVVTDILLLFALYKNSYLMGSQNKKFLEHRLGELLTLLKEKVIR